MKGVIVDHSGKVATMKEVLNSRRTYTRIVERFLFLPKTINSERRWLCSVTYKQRYQRHPYLSRYDEWVNVMWID